MHDGQGAHPHGLELAQAVGLVGAGQHEEARSCGKTHHLLVVDEPREAHASLQLRILPKCLDPGLHVGRCFFEVDARHDSLGLRVLAEEVTELIHQHGKPLLIRLGPRNPAEHDGVCVLREPHLALHGEAVALLEAIERGQIARSVGAEACGQIGVAVLAQVGVVSGGVLVREAVVHVEHPTGVTLRLKRAHERAVAHQAACQALHIERVADDGVGLLEADAQRGVGRRAGARGLEPVDAASVVEIARLVIGVVQEEDLAQAFGVLRVELVEHGRGQPVVGDEEVELAVEALD